LGLAIENSNFMADARLRGLLRSVLGGFPYLFLIMMPIEVFIASEIDKRENVQIIFQDSRWIWSLQRIHLLTE